MMKHAYDRSAVARQEKWSPGERRSDLKDNHNADPTVARGFRSASATRLIAIALDRNPISEFAKSEVERRWQVGPDTVRKILRTFGVDPGGQKGALIPLADLLLCEGVSEPIDTWITATARARGIYAADLLTLEQWIARHPEIAKRHATTHYRRLTDDRASIRIGHQHRFRIGTVLPSGTALSDEEGRR